MFYQALSAGLAVVALVLVLLSLRMVFRGGWFFAWMKGTAAILVAVFATGVALAAVDLYSYHGIGKQADIATVSVKAHGRQHYELVVTQPGAEPQRFDVHGDLWQLDVRVINWKGPLATMGLEPGYRLDRLSGRYLLLEQERDRERSVHEIQGSNFGFDLWRWLYDNRWLSWVDANYGAATYMPMKDGAQYVVTLGRQGVMARALNPAAIDAVDSWH